jgi:hypothetical protein
MYLHIRGSHTIVDHYGGGGEGGARFIKQISMWDSSRSILNVVFLQSVSSVICTALCEQKGTMRKNPTNNVPHFQTASLKI